MRDVKKSTNELIRIRKKKRAIRRNIFFTVVTTVVIVIFCLKHPYFNISAIEVYNNSLVATEEIVKLSDINIESNIFSLNKKEVKEKIVSNSYISEVTINRKLPATVILTVTERRPRYYIARGKEYILTDESGYALEIVQSVKGLDLVQLSGVDAEAAGIGSKVSTDGKKLNQIKVFSALMERNISEIDITSIGLEISSDIKVYFKGIMVKVGSIDDMESKLNRAINIITQQNIENSKGYIDVSFNGDPVISIEN
jgi:cell division protein FtsQ